jgi:hypothetical protein
MMRASLLSALNGLVYVSSVNVANRYAEIAYGIFFVSFSDFLAHIDGKRLLVQILLHP